MSEAIIFENMPYNLFLKQRMEFVVICGDHLAANVMRVFEREMIKLKEAWQVKVEKALENKKTPPPEPKTYWIRLSQAQIIARLYMYDSAKLKKPESEDLNSPEWVDYRFKKALSISKATLKKAIELLKELGFLIERSKPGDEFGAPIYTLSKANVQKAMKALPADPFTIFHHLGGVENFESGGESKNFNVPPQNSDSGESQKSDVPPEEFSPGESQNFRVDIDSGIDTSPDSEIDNEEESTYSERESQPATSGSAIASPTHAQSSQDDFHIIGEFIAERGGYHHPSKPWLMWDSLNAPSVICADLTGDPSEDVSRQAEAIRLRDHLSLRYQDIELIFKTQGKYHDLAGNIVDPLAEVPYRPDFTANQERAPLPQFFDEAIESVQRAASQAGSASIERKAEGCEVAADLLRGESAQANEQAQFSTQRDSFPQSAKVETKPKGARGKKDEPPSQEKKPEPMVMPPTDAEWKTTTCLQLFNFWRGHPLLSRYQNIKASQCAKALAENYSREQVEQVRAYMVERDEWWSVRPEKVDICTVAEHIHEKLAEIARNGKPPKKPAKAALPSYAHMNDAEYAAYLRGGTR